MHLRNLKKSLNNYLKLVIKNSFIRIIIYKNIIYFKIFKNKNYEIISIISIISYTK